MTNSCFGATQTCHGHPWKAGKAVADCHISRQLSALPLVSTSFTYTEISIAIGSLFYALPRALNMTEICMLANVL